MLQKTILKKLIIAIDGHSSCGKSSLAKDLSRELNYKYVDTGAMYRAVTLFLMQNHIDFDNLSEINQQLEHINISFENIKGQNTTFLNNVNVEDQIRSMHISKNVSKVATISEIRTFLVDQQRKMGKSGGLVMDGRDITTVVFPEAHIKIFLTANINTRTQRRFKELQEKGVDVSFEEVESNLKERDFIDSNRKDSPLLIAEDAIVFDNSYVTREEQLAMILALAKIRMK